MSKVLKAFAFVCAVVIVAAAPAFAGEGIVTAAVPEPSSIMMLVGGIGAIAGLRYYKLRK